MRHFFSSLHFLVLVGLVGDVAAANWKEGEVIAYAKQIKTSLLDPELPSVPFENWFQSRVGSSVSAKWEVHDCGETEGHGDNPPLCVGVKAKISSTERIGVYISVGGMKEGIIRSDKNWPHIFWVFRGPIGKEETISLRAIPEVK